tara:strand:- start:4713 stop:5516 length:804 start_codon:yes stop_codon:yes gene_type:complete
MKPNEEKILRDSIKHMIREVKNKRLNEEEKLRSVIRGFMDIELKNLSEGGTPDVDPTPNKSTGINVLEDLLKKIVPVLETDYKSLTTSDSQRKSFRAHIVNAVENALTPAKINTTAGDTEQSLEEDLEEEIEINIGDAAEDDEKFIDIRTDAEKAADEEEEEADPRDEFGSDVKGDETGRNMAYQSFKKIETSVIDSYELLADPEDQELFFDYLVANLKLYFEKFEEELAPSVEEPTNQAYDMAKSDQDAAGAGEEMGAEDDLELEL